MSLHRPFEECPKTWKTPFWCWEGVFQHLRDIIGSSKFYQIFQKVFKIDACNTSWGLLRASKECPKTWKTPSQCWHGVLNHFGLIVPSFIKFSTNLLKWCPRHSLGLLKACEKCLKAWKTPSCCREGVFQNIGHTIFGFVPLCDPLSIYHLIIICGFFELTITLVAKGLVLAYFRIVLASLKGCLLPLLFGLVVYLGGNQGGWLGWWHAPPSSNRIL